MITPTKICSKCNKEKLANEFYTRNNGKNLRTKCIKCLNPHEYKRHKNNNSQAYKENRKKAYKNVKIKQKFERANNINRPKYIILESRRQDTIHNRSYDLDFKFVEKLIQSGCKYCGAQPENCKMSIDRIDNTKGHIKTNVIPSCVNCNLTRGSMPYDAWITYLAPAMKQAMESGKLNNWKVNKYA